MPGLNGVQISKLAGVSKQAVYKADLPKNEEGLYDPTDERIAEWISGKKRSHRKQRNKESDTADLHNKSMEELEREEQEWRIAKTRAQAQSQELKNEEMRKGLIPVDVFDLALGAFASGIRNNFLQIGNRIARGDKELRDKIESEITTAIKKTIEGGEAQTEQIIDRKIEEIRSQEDGENNEQ